MVAFLLSGLGRRGVAQQANAAAEDEPEDEVTAAFRRAAEAVKEKREEEAMSVEERIYKCVGIGVGYRVSTSRCRVSASAPARPAALADTAPAL